MTKKAKLEAFDALYAERDKLALALYDVRMGKFGSKVRINPEDVMHGDYLKHEKAVNGHWTICVSQRAMPLYMVEYWQGRNPINGPCILTEIEIDDARTSQADYWRVVRHGLWLLRNAETTRNVYVTNAEVTA